MLPANRGQGLSATVGLGCISQVPQGMLRQSSHTCPALHGRPWVSHAWALTSSGARQPGRFCPAYRAVPGRWSLAPQALGKLIFPSPRPLHGAGQAGRAASAQRPLRHQQRLPMTPASKGRGQITAHPRPTARYCCLCLPTGPIKSVGRPDLVYRPYFIHSSARHHHLYHNANKNLRS